MPDWSSWKGEHVVDVRGSLIPGLVSVTFRQLGVADIVSLAADCGLGAIEWGGDVHVPVGDEPAAEQARSLCAEHGLAVASYGSYYRAGSTDPAEFDAVARTAAALGAPSIRVWAGRLGSNDAGPGERTAVVDALRRAVDSAAAHDIGVALEYHRNTLTDTVESTVDLLDSVGAGLSTYWQPFPGTSPEVARAQVDRLRDRLTTLHVFTWGADGARLPLADGAALWRDVLEQVGDAPTRYALLEFVAGDSPDQFRADAATLREWLSRA